MTIMNEIVGESGEPGQGCLLGVALVVGVVLAVTAVPVAVLSLVGVL